MADIKNEFSNAEVKKRWKPSENFNWNRRINIPTLWSGLVQDITPVAVEALIKQGRKDFIPVVAALKAVEKKEEEEKPK